MKTKKNGYEADKKSHKMVSSELNFQRLHHTTFGQESKFQSIYVFRILANNAVFSKLATYMRKITIPSKRSYNITYETHTFHGYNLILNA